MIIIVLFSIIVGCKKDDSTSLPSVDNRASNMFSAIIGESTVKITEGIDDDLSYRCGSEGSTNFSLYNSFERYYFSSSIVQQLYIENKVYTKLSFGLTLGKLLDLRDEPNESKILLDFLKLGKYPIHEYAEEGFAIFYYDNNGVKWKGITSDSIQNDGYVKIEEILSTEETETSFEMKVKMSIESNLYHSVDSNTQEINKIRQGEYVGSFCISKRD